jgi:hypothetical protein
MGTRTAGDARIWPHSALEKRQILHFVQNDIRGVSSRSISLSFQQTSHSVQKFLGFLGNAKGG